VRIQVNYGDRTFGNEQDAAQYGVFVWAPNTLAPGAKLSVLFVFDQSAEGKAVDPNTRGDVTGAKIELCAKDARQLAECILQQLDNPEPVPVSLILGTDRVKGV